MESDEDATMKMPASFAGRGAFIAGLLHGVGVAIFACFVLALSFVPVAQWQLSWLYLEAIDWPVSQLLWWDGWPRGPIAWLPYQLSDPLWFLVPCFVFGILGTAWYSLLGALLGALFRRLRARQHNVAHSVAG